MKDGAVMTPAMPVYDADVLLAEYERIEALNAGAGDRPGRIAMLGWDLEYPAPAALLSFVDQILFRRMNDFAAATDAPVIVDCGANIGYTVLHYKRCYPRASITAFEPDPQFLPLLRANLARNAADDVEVVPAAAWIADGRSSWVMEGRDGSRLGDGDQGQRTATVATVDLRKYLLRDVDLLKIDIEGAEFDVVPHLAPALGRVRNIVVECHLAGASTYDGLARLMTSLTGAGFRISVNSWGPWRDLIRRHTVAALHAEQYLTVYGWRGAEPAVLVEPTHMPYVGLAHYRRAAGVAGTRRQNEDVGRLVAELLRESSHAVVHRIEKGFKKERGHCWYYRLPEEFPAGDSIGDSDSATIVLESGRALGPGHTPHDDIRFTGRGLFSHWGPWLYLSTSDNSDPNTNGRVYTIVAIPRRRP
jgi:FkbM family methyltransferase